MPALATALLLGIRMLPPRADGRRRASRGAPVDVHVGLAARGSACAAATRVTARAPSAGSAAGTGGSSSRSARGKPVPVNSGSSQVPSGRCVRSRYAIPRSIAGRERVADRRQPFDAGEQPDQRPRGLARGDRAGTAQRRIAIAVGRLTPAAAGLLHALEPNRAAHDGRIDRAAVAAARPGASARRARRSCRRRSSRPSGRTTRRRLLFVRAETDARVPRARDEIVAGRSGRPSRARARSRRPCSDRSSRAGRRTGMRLSQPLSLSTSNAPQPPVRHCIVATQCAARAIAPRMRCGSG